MSDDIVSDGRHVWSLNVLYLSEYEAQERKRKILKNIFKSCTPAKLCQKTATCSLKNTVTSSYLVQVAAEFELKSGKS